MEILVASLRITYADATASDPELNARLSEALREAREAAPRAVLPIIAGREIQRAATFERRNPSDSRSLVAVGHSATASDVDDAVRSARRDWPSWRALPWPERAKILGRAAARVRARRFELAAALVLEVGKNRVEAMGEIDEVADLIDYYIRQMEIHDGFSRRMDVLSPSDQNTSVLRPYGVWAVLAPWNYPYALAAAPIAAALLTGNTVVFKPSSVTPLAGLLITQCFLEGGVPGGALSLVVGSGDSVGEALVRSPEVCGVTFTGSASVGNRIHRSFAKDYPRPCILEMGGKNPAIVMQSADLERAASGVYRSAFGMGGQKCSACSRVFVHRQVTEAFVEALLAHVRSTVIGDPAAPSTFLGPLAVASGFDEFQQFSDRARRVGTVVTGGAVLRDGPFEHGFFVSPTIVRSIPPGDLLLEEELFVPILCVVEVDDLAEAMEMANASRYALSAGIFTRDADEIARFLEEIEAGVVYVNRAAGATTGAWPGVQPFGGWKGSGSTGKGIGGPWTLPCYMREQSRTVSS